MAQMVQCTHADLADTLVGEYSHKYLIFFWSKCGGHTWMSTVANSKTHFQQSWKDLPRTQWLPLLALWCYNSGCWQWEHTEERLAAIKTWKVGFSPVQLAIKVWHSRGAVVLFAAGTQGPIQLIIVIEKNKSLNSQVCYLMELKELIIIWHHFMTCKMWNMYVSLHLASIKILSFMELVTWCTCSASVQAGHLS